MKNKPEPQRLSAEDLYAQELRALAQTDDGSRPPGWHLSPKAVRHFVLGSEGKKLSTLKQEASEFNGEPSVA